MTDNTIDTQAPEPTDRGDDPAGTGAPDDSQDANAEAKGWRLKYREQQQINADLVQQQVDLAAKLRAAERVNINSRIGSRVRDPEDFWSKTEHADLLDEDGAVDMSKVDEHLGELLTEKPHWAAPAPGTPAVAPTPVTGDGTASQMIGGRPYSVLDHSQIAAEQPSWSDVLQGNIDQMRPSEM